MEELVRIESVSKHFPIQTSPFTFGQSRRVLIAVDHVALSISKGETLGIVGESGSGKTTLGRMTIRLTEPTSGIVYFNGRNLNELNSHQLRTWRKQAQMIFQDPNASLPPKMTLGNAIGRSAAIHLKTSKEAHRTTVENILERVGLKPSSKFYNKYPNQVSGGERQRAIIARALVSNPEFIVADEPVAMLDVSVRAQIIELLHELKQNLGLTYMLITHDLSVAGYLCDRVAIMYLGRIVEIGETDEIFSNPQHPYTMSLLKAVPAPDPEKRRIAPIVAGEIPSAIDRPSGCHFHPRCKYAVDTCKTTEPEKVKFSETHSARCPVKPFSNR